jgi:uncharacterized protein
MRTPMLSVATAALVALLTFTTQNAVAAEKKVVLQISDGSPEKQTLVLNVANNLINYYRNDELKLEIVAFGPGLQLLFADNANKDRIQSLTVSGVRFSACQNTVAAMTKLLGHAPALDEHAVPVPAGIGRIVDLTAQGYVLVRP